MSEFGGLGLFPWRSSSATRCGVLHTVNEDSLVEAVESGVFLIADGMGGHADGAVASRAIAEVIRRVTAVDVALEEHVVTVEEALQSVNIALRQEALARGRDVIGSTVAVLLLDATYAVCIWAGDSRVYLLRDGHLYRLTRDHAVGVEEGLDIPGAPLTRAVGSADELMLDRLVTSLQAGDTFLVCSDGINKAVSDDQLEAVLADPVDGLAARIVAQAVTSGSRDDASAIVVRYEGEGTGNEGGAP